MFDHELHRLDHALDPDPVADEIGCVLGPDDPLAEDPFAKVGHEGKDFRQGLFSGDDLQKFHVADRIEEMGPEEMFAEILAQSFAHGLQGDARGVGRDDGALSAHAVDPLEEILLDLQVFDDHFDDPVAVFDLVEIVFKVADGNPRGVLWLHEQGRAGFDDGVQAGFGDAVAGDRVAFFFIFQIEGDNVQQQRFHSGTGQ